VVAEALFAKYVEIRSLRSGGVDEDVRPRLRALAERFPGALRELDELSTDEIDSRIAALDRVVHEQASVEPWMAVMCRFHDLTRAALRAKRWLGSQRSIDDRTREAFVRAHANDEAIQWTEQLQELATPPTGRISQVVVRRVAREHHVSLEDAVCLVRGR
jgi:hypothetical protein